MDYIVYFKSKFNGKVRSVLAKDCDTEEQAIEKATAFLRDVKSIKVDMFEVYQVKEK